MRAQASITSSFGKAPGRRIAAILMLITLTLLAGCSQGKHVTAKKGAATATATSAPRGYTPAPGSTASASPQATPANSPFICANPAGSSLTYAFVNADRQIYMVTGCSAPVQLTHIQRPDTYSAPTPVAWSPSHRYLAFQPNLQSDFCLEIVDTSSGATLPTQYNCFNGDPSASGDDRTFIGWLDDNTFLGRIDIGSANAPNPVHIMKVDVHSQAETAVASFSWMSDQKLRGNALFFGGRVNPNDTNAFLYRLSLVDGSVTKLVSLGLSGTGGCQVDFGPCSWTAPWDVSPDGAHVLYHNPGAPSFPSDTNAPTDTPVYYANLDGSGATRVLSGQWQYLIAAEFDPSGSWIFATTPGSTNTNDIVYQPVAGGSIQRLPNQYNFFWRSDGQALVNVVISYDSQSTSTVTLISPGASARTPLAPNTYFYLWA